MEKAVCAVLDCRKPILDGDIYYILGGGKVINCKECACHSTYTIKVNGEPITLQRGWDKTAVIRNIEKTML